ncbi:thioesterase domain-containing protein [Actinocrispum sp. NPDC049592]|uniref:thioesterase domain-containing protein n=1 Tax=Actinocrispum sp. NPDC049592 TaxID=3154835 RepID=UPI003439E292
MPATDTVVMVHPGALPASCYAGLAREVDLLVIDLEQIPSYRAMMLHDDSRGVSVAGLAEHVADRIVRISGPWLLAGWSLGGVIAYAATSLLPDHRLPLHLVALDSIAPVPENQRRASDFPPEVLVTWFAGYLAAKRGGRLTVDVPGGLSVEDALAVVLREAIRTGLVWPDVTVAGMRKLFEVYLTGLFRNVDLTAGYEAPPARVPMTLVRPAVGLLATPGALGWQRLAPALTVEHCPGDHYSMVGETDAIAGVFRSRLAGQLI